MNIQCSISGFKGRSATIVSALDEATGLILVAKAPEYRDARIRADLAMVSNVMLPDMDFMFTDKHLRDSIRAYFARVSQGLITVEEKIARVKPDNMIEPDGVDEVGRKYRISPDIDNAQIAVLATVAFVESQRPIAAAIDMARELRDFFVPQTI